MEPITILLIVAGIALLAWFIISLIWGKPWTVHLLHLRTFLGFALTGPELLTMLGILEKFGIHAHNAKLSDESVAHETKILQFIKRDLGILRSYKRERQAPPTRLSSDIMEWFLDAEARGERFRFHDYPVNQMFGIQSQLPNFMLTLHPIISRLEGRNYIKRLNRFGVKFDQVLAGLRVREHRGVLPPRSVIRRLLDEMTAFTDQPATENPLYTVFRDKLAKLERLSQADREALLAGAAGAIQRTVYPAYQKLIAYFTALEQKATIDDGVWKLPDGAAFYAHCLRSSTTTECTPEQVHEIGLQEVARIEGEMAAILRGLGHSPEPSAPRKLAELAQEERFQYPNTDEGRQACLEDYQRILDEMNARLDPYFATRPKGTLKVERVPEFREKTSAGAYHQPGDLGGPRPGVFYANLPNMPEAHKFGMKTPAYNEGIPVPD